MATCLVYLRQSSTGETKQKSLGQQKHWATEILKKRIDLDVIGLDWRICEIPQNGFIQESHSAKEDGPKRPLFEKMIQTIKDFWVDWIIVCHPDRISRNSVDMVEFMSLLSNKNPKIHQWIITESYEYKRTSPSDMMIFEQYLLDAKKENVKRGSDAIISQSYHKGENGIFSSQMPFGYDSLHGGWKVEINNEKASLVRLAYKMRLEWCQWTEIAKEFQKAWYKKIGGGIKAILEHPVYYGEFLYKGKMMPVKKPMTSTVYW